MQLPLTLSIITFLLLFTRVVCVLMTAPILGTRTVPIKYRLLLAGLISMAAFPLATAHTMTLTGNTIQPAAIVSALMSEIVIGILLGLGVTILFAAAQAAGSVLAQMAGVQWPTQADPDSGEATSAVSHLFAMISLAAFALMGGPELVLGALLQTCVELPLGSSLATSDVVNLLTQLLQQSFLLTLRGVGPGVAALLISTIVIGLISRTYPQMNTLGLGLNSNQLVLFLAIFLTLGSSVWLFVDDLDLTLAMILDTLRS